MDPGDSYGLPRARYTAKQNSHAANLPNASTSHVHSYAAEFQLALHDSVEPDHWNRNTPGSHASSLVHSEDITAPTTGSNEREPILSLEQALNKSPHSAIWRVYMSVMPPTLRSKMEIKLREDPTRDEAFLRASCDEFWHETFHSQEHNGHLKLPPPQERQQRRQQKYHHDRVPQHNQQKGALLQQLQPQQCTVAANQDYYHNRQAASNEQNMPVDHTTVPFGQLVQQQQQQKRQQYYHSRKRSQSAMVAANQSYYRHRTAKNEQDMSPNQATMLEHANPGDQSNYHRNSSFGSRGFTPAA